MDEAFEPVIRTLPRYLNAVDTKDRPAVAEVFAPDATAIYNASAVDEFTVDGREEITDRLFAHIDGFGETVHALANWSCGRQGREVACVSLVLAHIRTGPRLVTRGLRYDDRLVVGDARWLIVRRAHHPLWQTETMLSEARLPSPRG